VFENVRREVKNGVQVAFEAASPEDLERAFRRVFKEYSERSCGAF
jgi:hypothetical protein